MNKYLRRSLYLRLIITYKYNLIEDLRWSFRTLKNREWLQKKGLKVFYPNIFRLVKLLVKQPKVDTQTKEDITCYWIHAGTWGSYTPPDKIFICPWQIEEVGGFDKVIKHELTHLKYFKETEKMSHEAKEEFINKKQ